MRFTITPLGGGRRDIAKVVGSIVRYLQPPPKEGPVAPAPDQAARPDGPSRYYADSGEEPGRWVGKAAQDTGLVGSVRREDFASVLAGRDPHTGERLITAQGSAGRRTDLGAGTHTAVGADGELLFSEADAAAALGVTQREVSRMLDVGTGIASSSSATIPVLVPVMIPVVVPVTGTRLIPVLEVVPVTLSTTETASAALPVPGTEGIPL